MKTCLFACLVLLAPPSFAQQSVPEIPFDSVPDFPQASARDEFRRGPGRGRQFQGPRLCVHALQQRRRSGLWAAAAQLLEFGPKGEFLREIGKGLYAWSEAHSVRIDKDDNIWAIDKGSDMVIKFNQAGRVVWTSAADQNRPTRTPSRGTHPDPPLPPVDGLFRQPTDVAWDSEGNIYITDGYVNSRVAKYDKNGDWVKSWGDQGTGPGQFRIPARHRGGSQQQHLCGRSDEPAHPGVRYRGQVSAHVHHRRASRSRNQGRQRPRLQPASAWPR